MLAGMPVRLNSASEIHLSGRWDGATYSYLSTNDAFSLIWSSMSCRASAAVMLSFSGEYDPWYAATAGLPALSLLSALKPSRSRSRSESLQSGCSKSLALAPMVEPLMRSMPRS